MHLYKTRGLRCLEITHEQREVRNHSRKEEDIENGVIQMMEERKYGGYHVNERNNGCLCFNTGLGIMGADTHAQGLRLRANVTVRQKIIPVPMSKYTEIITH